MADRQRKQTVAQNIMKPTEFPFLLLLVSPGLDSKAAQTQNRAPGTERKRSKKTSIFGPRNSKVIP